MLNLSIINKIMGVKEKPKALPKRRKTKASRQTVIDVLQCIVINGLISSHELIEKSGYSKSAVSMATTELISDKKIFRNRGKGQARLSHYGALDNA